MDQEPLSHDELANALAKLPAHEHSRYHGELKKRQLSIAVATTFLLFAGAFGAHRFYLGDKYGWRLVGWTGLAVGLVVVTCFLCLFVRRRGSADAWTEIYMPLLAACLAIGSVVCLLLLAGRLINDAVKLKELIAQRNISIQRDLLRELTSAQPPQK